jgi:hypothetical protein
MVKILAVLLALTAAARADDLDDGPPLLLGFRLAAGKLPVAHEELTTVTMGLDVDHPIAARWRAFGEYEWMWLDRDGMSTQHGSGHRLLAGLRHSLVEKREHHVRTYLDVEGGGGMSVVDDTVIGVRMLPTGFGGLRGGYEFDASDSPSRVLEVEVLVRAVVVADGTGVMAGFGMQWGD